jgi:hypothetical protein
MTDSPIDRAKSARAEVEFWRSFISTRRETLGEVALARCEEAANLAAQRLLYAELSSGRRPAAEQSGRGGEHDIAAS